MRLFMRIAVKAQVSRTRAFSCHTQKLHSHRLITSYFCFSLFFFLEVQKSSACARIQSVLPRTKLILVCILLVIYCCNAATTTICSIFFHPSLSHTVIGIKCAHHIDKQKCKLIRRDANIRATKCV